MKNRRILSGVASGLLLTVNSLFAADLLTAQNPIELTGTQGRFDFIKINANRHRLLACHTGNGSLDIIDTKLSKLMKSVPLGAAQGVAIDEKKGCYYVSVSKPPKLVIIDSAELKVTGEVPLPHPADLVSFHSGSNRVFVCNDEKPELWVIDPVEKKILTTLTLPGGGMEDLDFDPLGSYLFQCLKESSELAKINPQTGKLVAHWSTLPSDKPHGLAIVPELEAVLVAGGTGKLSLFSLSTGQVLASTDIPAKVDEIAYDPIIKRVYCASGLGLISIVSLDKGKLINLATVPTPSGTHSITVDNSTHAVWIAFVKDGKPYVQSLVAEPSKK